jgi:hypothetical protein
MLQLARAGTSGTERGTLPVLEDGAVVATLRTAKVREAATAAVVGGEEWLFERRGRALVGRRASDPEQAERLTATQASWWRGTWAVDLDGTRLEMRPASAWRGTHRYLRDGQSVAESGFTGRWLRLPTLTFTEPMPLPGRVFLLWVELVLTRRSATTAAAVAAGGAAAAAGAAG